LAVAAHGEEDLLAVERRLWFEDRAALEVGQPRQLTAWAGGNQGVEVAPGADGAHGAFALVVGGAAGVDVAVAPVVAPLVDAGAAISLLVERRGGDEDDTRDGILGLLGWALGRNESRQDEQHGTPGNAKSRTHDRLPSTSRFRLSRLGALRRWRRSARRIDAP